MIRKYNIVQNVDLMAQKIIVFSSTEQAMQAEANSNTTAKVTLSLDLHFSIFPSGFSDCSLSSVSSAHKQAPGHREHPHHYRDAGFSAQGRLSLEVQMPMADCSMLHSEDHWLFLPLWSMSLHIYIFCTQNTLIWHWQSVDQNSSQTVWTSKAVEITKRWFFIVPPTQFVPSEDVCIRCHSEKPRWFSWIIQSLVCAAWVAPPGHWHKGQVLPLRLLLLKVCHYTLDWFKIAVSDYITLLI